MCLSDALCPRQNQQSYQDVFLGASCTCLSEQNDKSLPDLRCGSVVECSSGDLGDPGLSLAELPFCILEYCKFGNFSEGFIFAKLRISEVS